MLSIFHHSFSFLRYFPSYFVWNIFREKSQNSRKLWNNICLKINSVAVAAKLPSFDNQRIKVAQPNTENILKKMERKCLIFHFLQPLYQKLKFLKVSFSWNTVLTINWELLKEKILKYSNINFPSHGQGLTNDNSHFNVHWPEIVIFRKSTKLHNQ